jgi:hypothetical protein
MAKEKKLTIKHFYGEDLKIIGSNPDKLFPLYIQLTYNRKNTRIKSFSLNTAFEITRYNLKVDPAYEGKFDYAYETTINSMLQPKYIKYYIEHDIKIINILKKLFEDNFTRDFDLSFFTSDICKNLVVPIDFFIDLKLHSMTLDFFSSKKNTGIINLLNPYRLGLIIPFIRSVEELNKKIYNDLMDRKLFSFYFRLSSYLIEQRKDPKVFYFVFDIYNQENLDSLLLIAKNDLNDDFEEFKETLINQLSGKIYQIFSGE